MKFLKRKKKKRNQIKWKTVLKISSVGILGTVAGGFLADFLGGDILGKIFGLLLVLLGVREIFGKKTKTVESENKKCYTKKAVTT